MEEEKNERVEPLSKREYEKKLAAIRKLRASLNAVTDRSKREEIIITLFDKTDELEYQLNHTLGLDELLEADIEKIDSERASLEEQLENDIVEYEKLSNEMSDLIYEQEQFFEKHNLKEEEIASSLENYARRKFEINRKSVTLQNRIQESKRLIQYLNDIKNKDQKELVEEETRQEEERHLEEVAKAKKEELAKERRKEILNGIEVLYTTHLTCDGKENHPKDAIVREEQMQVINQMIDSVPQKIKGVPKVQDYEPDKVPKDLEDVDMSALQESMMEKVLEPKPTDILPIYFTKENPTKYVTEEILNRFHLIPANEPVVLEGKTCYPLKEEDIQYIMNNQINDYAPYYIEEKELVLPTIKEEKEEKKEEKSTTKKPEPTKETLVIYQDEELDKVYASIETLQRFGVFPLKEYIFIEEKPYYQIRQEDLKKIQNFIEKNKEKLSLEIKAIANEKPEVEEMKLEEDSSILDKINLSVPEKEEYTYTNIRSSKPFLEELKKGEYSYNIITGNQGTKDASKSFVELLAKDFNNAPTMKEFKEKINQLTDTDVEFLIHELEEHKIENLNPVVLDRIKKTVVEKLNACEKNIASEYANLFHVIEQIKALEESLNSDTITKDKTDAFLSERRSLLREGTFCVQEIVDMRNMVDQLIGKGVFINILEFSKQFPYIGMRYGKDLSEEVQNFLEQSQEDFEMALEKNDSEGIVSSFINIESCYYKEPKINHKKGNHIIGINYYDVLQNQFGFQNDSFIKQITAKEASVKATSHDVVKKRIQDIRFSSLLDNMEELQELKEEEFLDKKPMSEELQALDRELAEYKLNRISQEEVINSIEELKKESNAKLVDSVNSASISLKKFEEKNPLYNVNDLQEKLELLITHPELICSFDSLESERLYSELMILPKELLSSLVSNASSVVLAQDLENYAKKIKDM